MNNQDKLKKLADMAGYKSFKDEDEHGVETGEVILFNGFKAWDPLNDMNQALEVWRASGSEFFSIDGEKDGTFTATLDPCPWAEDWHTGKTEAESLCNCLLEIDNA
jgi:hypothetical protein